MCIWWVLEVSICLFIYTIWFIPIPKQDGINLNSMVRCFFRSRVDTDIVLHQSGWGKVFLAYQGFGTEESEKKVWEKVFS